MSSSAGNFAGCAHTGIDRSDNTERQLFLAKHGTLLDMDFYKTEIFLWVTGERLNRLKGAR